MSLYNHLWDQAYRMFPDGVTPPPEYVEIDENTVDDVVAYFSAAEGVDVAVDTETYGDKKQKKAGRRFAGDALHQVYAQVSTIGFYDGAFLFAARRTNATYIARVLEALRGCTLLFWNAPFDRAVLRNSGFDIMDYRYRDVMVCKWLICHRLFDKIHGEMTLAWFVKNILRGEKGSFREEVGMDATDMDNIDEGMWNALLVRVSGDTYYTYEANKIISRVLPDVLKTEYQEVEVPVSDIVVSMETRGIRVDEGECIELHTALMMEAADLNMAFQERAGKHGPINLDSPKQLAHYFYDVLGMGAFSREEAVGTKTEDISRSTAVGVLEKWVKEQAVVEAALVLDYRKVTKMARTYILGPLQDVDDHGRIYPKTNHTGTSTGRFSMDRPSLHNLPAREDPRWIEILVNHMKSRGEPVPYDVEALLSIETQRYGLRKIYVPDEGCVFVGADYSQVELRVLAHFSEEPTLVDIFNKGGDPHHAAGAMLMNIPYEEFAERMRDGDPEAKRYRGRGKTLNFAVVYGAGPHSVAGQLGVSKMEAQNFLREYFAKLPYVKKMKERVEFMLRKRGEVRTLLNRVRPIGAFQKPISYELGGRSFSVFKDAVQSFGVIAEGLRQAFNAVIQGSAADIIKLAMIRIHQDPTLRDLGASLVLSIHDEVIMNAPKQVAQEVADRVVKLMRRPMDPDEELLIVPLKVDYKIGDNMAVIK